MIIMSRELRNELEKAEEKVEEIKNKIRFERLKNVTEAIKNYIALYDNAKYDSKNPTFPSWANHSERIERICEVLDKNSSYWDFKFYPCRSITLNGKDYAITNKYIVEAIYEERHLYDIVSFFEWSCDFFKELPYDMWWEMDELDRILDELEEFVYDDYELI